jgi:hypothetical protein
MVEIAYRIRFSGHGIAFCGAPDARVEPDGAGIDRAEVAVLLDQPLGVVAGGEGAEGVADLVDGEEDVSVDGLLRSKNSITGRGGALSPTGR